MRKTLLALAVGAAFIAPSAFADVTISGSINMAVEYLDVGDADNNPAGPAGDGISNFGVSSNYSNVTISSVDDLGGGLKLDFAYQITAPTSSVGGVSNRNSHIGLVSDSWGGVWYGSNENMYERYYYTVDPLDGAAGIGGNLAVLGSPGYGQVFDAGNGLNGVGSAEFYRRTDHTVWYDSPNWGGFTFGAYTTLSAAKQNGPNSVANPGNPRVWGLGGKWVGPTIPLQVWAAYEKHNDLYGLQVITGTAGAATSTKDHGIQLGVGYTLGDIFLFANWEQLKYEADGLAGATVNEYKRNAWSVGLKWNLPTGYIGAQYMQAQSGKCAMADGSACDASNSGAKVIGLGYYHTLSKQTQAYVMATYIKNGDLQSYLPAGGGTNVGTGVGVNLGANIWGATVGLKHSF